MGTWTRAAIVGLAVLSVTAGCAARGGGPPVERKSARRAAQPAPQDSLEVFMGKVRARSERAGPRSERARTVEASDPALAAAVLALEARQSPAAHRTVATEYMRLGIFDAAHDHLTAAVAFDPRDAAAWDAMARIWRDWGFPHLALPDAHRALYYAPGSPVAHNTLGTILQALGRGAAARAQYEKALALDVTAAYALTNLCHGLLLERGTNTAVEACRHALSLRAAQEAASRELRAARPTSAPAVNEGQEAFDAGILLLARRQYPAALKAFESARAVGPWFRAADVIAGRTPPLPREEGEP